jgi:hypothetical protein
MAKNSGHILRNHTSWEQLPYRCVPCQKGFADKDTLIGSVADPHMFLGIRNPHPDPLVRYMDPDPSIIKKK